MIKSLSVFFPTYNEEKNIARTVENAIRVLQKYSFAWEVIIVNDGSKDKTLEVAKKIAAANKNVCVVDHRVNGGYGMALRSGFAKAKYDWVVYTDSDGQFDFSQLSKFLTLTDKYDAIWGYRHNRKDSLDRYVLAKIWGLSVRLLLGLNLKDTDCGFKMIKKSAFEKILPLTSTRGAMINAEIGFKLVRSGQHLGQVQVAHFPRLNGKPTGSNIRVAVKSYLELFKTWSENF